MARRTSAPGDDRPLFYVSQLAALHAARHSIGLSTGYFVATHQEPEELAKAARQGGAPRSLDERLHEWRARLWEGQL